jgi:diacylglycerol kinase (ATP)
MKMKAIINGALSRRRIADIELALLVKFKRDIISLEKTRYPGHATILADQAVKDKADLIIIAGGDGTINEVVNGLQGASLPLAIIPAGTANDLAAQYNIPNNIMLACDIIKDGFARYADLIRINDWDFITTGGMALPCESLLIAEKVKRRRQAGRVISYLLKRKIYLLSTLLAFLKQRQHRNKIAIRFDGECRNIDLFSLVVANQPILGGNYKVAPDAVNDDGLFDLFIIENGKGWRPLWKAVSMTRDGRQGNLNNVFMTKLSELTIESERPLAFFGDGEIKQHNTKYHIQVIPRAVKIIVPRKTEKCSNAI